MVRRLNAGFSRRLKKAVAEDPVRPADFNATVATVLGLPLDKRIFAPNGRPFFIANKGEPIAPLIG